MTLLDAVALDLHNSSVVLDAARDLQDELQQSARLGSKVNEHLVFLRMQVARYVNEMSEYGWKILGQAE